MAYKITIANQKGGIGKTTVTSMLAYQLAEQGKKVLVVDFDPQGNTTQLFNKTFFDGDFSDFVSLIEGIQEGDLSKSIANATENLDFIPSPSSIEAAAGFKLLLTKKNSYTLLKKHIERIESRYDYIFFDIPPTIFTDFLNNALTASDYFIILTETSSFSFEGISEFHATAEGIHENLNPNLNFLGILINKLQEDEEINAELDKAYNFDDDDLFFRTRIPRRKRIAKFMEKGMYYRRKTNPYIKLDRWDTDAYEVFEQLANELREKVERGLK